MLARKNPFRTIPNTPMKRNDANDNAKITAAKRLGINRCVSRTPLVRQSSMNAVERTTPPWKPPPGDTWPDDIR